MTDEYGEVFGLEAQELAEFNAVISGMLIPKLMQIADKYNIDRDSMIKFTADTLTAMSELATFERWGDAE
jgi:hypothetical protein